ncbi:MAG: hypothetical protein DSZ28_02350 [Thiothrix sp.]|nr:MAG: hypothetical protein DSZ28_02350 [Thiothrix sp.]
MAGVEALLSTRNGTTDISALLFEILNLNLLNPEYRGAKVIFHRIINNRISIPKNILVKP